MSVEIITHGKLKDRRRYTHCNECGCEFSFLPEDFKYEEDQRESTGFWRVRCPEAFCGHELIVYKK